MSSSRGEAGVWWALLASVVTLGAGLALSNQYFCFNFAAAILAGIVFALIDAGLAAKPPKARRRARLWLVASIAALSFLTPLMRLSADAAATEIFDRDLPTGVKVHSVWRRYCGGPGDYTTMLMLEAPPEAIEALLSATKFETDSSSIEIWREKGATWEGLRSAFFHASPWNPGEWEAFAPFDDPQILRRRLESSDRIEILVDGAQRRMIALFNHG